MELMEIIENSELEPKNLTVEELFHIVLYELSFSFKATLAGLSVCLMFIRFLSVDPLYSLKRIKPHNKSVKEEGIKGDER